MSSRPKLVVHCIRSDNFAGVERYVANVAPELALRGWDIHVIGGDPTRMRAELGPISYTPAATTVAVANHLLHYDRGAVIHAHMTAAEAAAVAAHTLRRFSLVSTRHFAAPRGSTPVGRLGARLVERVIDRQIAVSRFVARSIGGSPIIVLNGVPANHRAPTPESMVLVAQRLESEKCTDIAIHAWARSKLRHAGWRLAVAGGGRQSAELARLADRLDLSDSVEFIGSQADVTSLMSRAAIFLATAPAEPFGLSVAEAMAAGVPVLAARGGGHMETVGAVSDRWLFANRDSDAVAAMLDSLGADQDQRQRYGAALRDWQRRHLSIQAHVDQLEQVYAELGR